MEREEHDLPAKKGAASPFATTASSLVLSAASAPASNIVKDLPDSFRDGAAMLLAVAMQRVKWRSTVRGTQQSDS